MQLYLARVDRVGVHTPDYQFEENTETVRLLDGHRGVYMPVCYLKRSKITAGEYLIFYRVGFRYEKQSTPGKTPGAKTPVNSPKSVISSKIQTSNGNNGMDDATD